MANPSKLRRGCRLANRKHDRTATLLRPTGRVGYDTGLAPSLGPVFGQTAKAREKGGREREREREKQKDEREGEKQARARRRRKRWKRGGRVRRTNQENREEKEERQAKKRGKTDKEKRWWKQIQKREREVS